MERVLLGVEEVTEVAERTLRFAGAASQDLDAGRGLLDGTHERRLPPGELVEQSSSENPHTALLCGAQERRAGLLGQRDEPADEGIPVARRTGSRESFRRADLEHRCDG